MNREVFEVYKERLIFIPLNEIDGGIGQLIRVVIALVRWQRFVVLTTEGIVIGFYPSSDGLIEAIGLRIFAQMCFSVVGGSVSMLLQCFCQRDLFIR